MTFKARLRASAAGYPLFMASHGELPLFRLCDGAADLAFRRWSLAGKADRLSDLIVQAEALTNGA